MNALPESVFVRRSDVVGPATGISKRDFEKAVRVGALRRHVFPGCSYGKYLREDVVRVFEMEKEGKAVRG